MEVGLRVLETLWGTASSKSIVHVMHSRAGIDFFSFWSYELLKQNSTSKDDSDRDTAMKVLLCGGLAGIITWASIFPLDVIKTRLQTQVLHERSSQQGEHHALLAADLQGTRKSSLGIARHLYRTEGAGVFFRGLGICSVRAFVVNAVQWAVYEWMMRLMQKG
jgi:solute carrier family 25 carnitine/acylcarnitine transporter 20/29